MPRPRQDGNPPNPTRRERLTEALVKSVQPPAKGRLLIHDTDIRGFCLSIESSGTKVYKIIYSHENRKRWYRIGPANGVSVKAARDVARGVVGAILQGKDPQGDRLYAARSPTFEAIMLDYLGDTNVIKATVSLRATEKALRRAILPEWGGRRANAITGEEAYELHGRLSSERGNFAANEALYAASAVFSWALAKDFRRKKYRINQNPCREVDYHKGKIRTRVLSDAEVGQFLGVVDDYDPVVAAALKVLLFTGQRRIEVTSMRRVDVVGRWWHLSGEKTKTPVVWCGTKNKNSHRVYLSEPVRQILEGLDASDSGYAFQRNPRSLCNKVGEAMKTISKRLGWSIPARPHDLRRTHATKITSLGYGRDAMNRIQNHVTRSVADHYDHYKYENEFIKIQEAVAAAFLTCAAQAVANAA